MHKTLFERMSDRARANVFTIPKNARGRPSRDEVLRQDHADLAERMTNQPQKRA